MNLGDVLVVDPEAQFSDFAVRPSEQGENGVGEGQLTVDAFGVEGGKPGSTSPVWDPEIGSYWVSTSMNSGTRIGFPSTPITQPPSTFITRGARSFMLSGNRSKKMSSAKEMWPSAENTSVPAGSPRSTGRARPAILRRAQAFRPVRGRHRCAVISPASRCARTIADYFGLVAIVNGLW